MDGKLPETSVQGSSAAYIEGNYRIVRGLTLLFGSILHLRELLLVSLLHCLQVIESLCHLQLMLLGIGNGRVVLNYSSRMLPAWLPSLSNMNQGLPSSARGS